MESDIAKQAKIITEEIVREVTTIVLSSLEDNLCSSAQSKVNREIAYCVCFLTTGCYYSAWARITGHKIIPERGINVWRRQGSVPHTIIKSHLPEAKRMCNERMKQWRI